MRRVGLLFSGCGIYDGSEVQETVLLILALKRRGLRLVLLAPDVEQRDTVDHTTGEAIAGAERRSVLVESARVTRGAMQALHDVSPEALDALVILGGLGAVKNLFEPGEGRLGIGPLRREVASVLDALSQRGAPVAAVGMGEVVLARHQGRPLDPDRAAFPAGRVDADDERNTLFTPGFMGTDEVTEVAEGIDRLVEELARRLGVIATPRQDR